MPTLKEAAIANMIPLYDENHNVNAYTADSVSIALDSYAIQLKAQAINAADNMSNKTIKEIALDYALKTLAGHNYASTELIQTAELIYQWLIK